MAEETEDIKKDENSKDEIKGEQTQEPAQKASSKSPYKRVEVSDVNRQGAMEVTVDHNIEKALKILKRKLIKEGLFKELKLRRYYEKPSEKKKRKHKESLKKLRKEESRLRRNPHLFS